MNTGTSGVSVPRLSPWGTFISSTMMVMMIAMTPSLNASSLFLLIFLQFSPLTSFGICSGSGRPELLGEPDENSFRAPDVAEPIRVFVLDHFADKLRAAFAEPIERIVDVLYGEHDA